jgi:RP/EB family microtubule-associated protein
MAEADTIGMMEGAFFVGRGELLAWINDFFGLQLTKVEQCATGAVYCQIIDAIYPGTVPMTKVRWGAKHDYEYVENYKVLQQAFMKNGIKRYIDVDKLVKAKYQDNLEFLQWLKRFFDIKFNGQPYDALGRRKGQDLFYILGGNKVAIGGASAQPTAANKAPTKIASTGGIKQSIGAKASVGGASKASKAGGDGGDVSKVQAEMQELRMNMDTVEKERDFYFGKLRDIEMLLQANEARKTALTENVMKILYASEEEKILIGEDGSLSISSAGVVVASSGAED